MLKRIIKVVFINVFILLGLLTLLEIGINIVLESKHQQPIKPINNIVNYFEPEGLGYLPAPNQKAKALLFVDGKVIYDVIYDIDSLGRRRVPYDPNKKYDQFLVFLGGSNTFGEGLSQSENLPAQMAMLLSDYKVYNYAYSGYGTNNVLALVDSQRLRSEIKEDSGVFVYHYFSYHADRVTGSSRYFVWGKGRHPFYDWNSLGQLEHKGDFLSAQPIRTRLLMELGKTNILKKMKINYQGRKSKIAQDKVCQMFEQIRDGLKKQKPKSKFLVILAEDQDAQSFEIQCLQSKGIAFAMAETTNLKKNALHPIYDKHYNAKYIKHWASELTAYIRNSLVLTH